MATEVAKQASYSSAVLGPPEKVPQDLLQNENHQVSEHVSEQVSEPDSSESKENVNPSAPPPGSQDGKDEEKDEEKNSEKTEDKKKFVPAPPPKVNAWHRNKQTPTAPAVVPNNVQSPTPAAAAATLAASKQQPQSSTQRQLSHNNKSHQVNKSGGGRTNSRQFNGPREKSAKSPKAEKIEKTSTKDSKESEESKKDAAKKRTVEATPAPPPKVNAWTKAPINSVVPPVGPPVGNGDGTDDTPDPTPVAVITPEPKESPAPVVVVAASVPGNAAAAPSVVKAASKGKNSVASDFNDLNSWPSLGAAKKDGSTQEGNHPFRIQDPSCHLNHAPTGGRAGRGCPYAQHFRYHPYSTCYCYLA
eukprot:XP_011672557.1 PREDICTED: pollen-specific leucine-rich repeat extensin-like protein 1 [Strongylocentrotus purpuratus]